MLDALHEIDDVELFLKLEMGDLGSVKQLHIDIGLLVLNVSQNLVQRLVVIGVDGILEVLLRLLDKLVDIVAEADGSFLLYTVFVLVNPASVDATLREEFAAILTVVLDVTEIKLGPTALLTFAVRLLDTFSDQCPRLRVSGEIDWGMTSRILEMDISPE